MSIKTERGFIIFSRQREDNQETPGENRKNLLKSADGDETQQKGLANLQDLNYAIVPCVFGYWTFYGISKISETAI